MAGTLTIDTLQDGSSNSSSVTDVVKGSARAWVNFDGTGTVAIKDAYNVSSITDLATGQYNVHYTISLPDVNYALLHNTNGGSASVRISTSTSTKGVSLTHVRTIYSDATNGSYTDVSENMIAVFR